MKNKPSDAHQGRKKQLTAMVARNATPAQNISLSVAPFIPLITS